MDKTDVWREWTADRAPIPTGFSYAATNDVIFDETAE